MGVLLVQNLFFLLRASGPESCASVYCCSEECVCLRARQPQTVLNLLRGPAQSGLQQEVQMLMLDFLGKENEEGGQTTTNGEHVM